MNRLDNGGTVTSGSLADLVVLNTNPFDLDPAELHTVFAEFTMVDGQPVHTRNKQEALR